MVLHDAENGGKTQTHAITFLFGRKKRFKKMGKITIRYAVTGVADRNFELIFSSIPFAANRQGASLRHGIDGIEYQVYDTLLKLIEITGYTGQPRLDYTKQLNIP